MAGWLHGVFVGAWLFVFPLCGFSLSLFCNYYMYPQCYMDWLQMGLHGFADAPASASSQLIYASTVINGSRW